MAAHLCDLSIYWHKGCHKGLEINNKLYTLHVTTFETKSNILLQQFILFHHHTETLPLSYYPMISLVCKILKTI